MLDMELFCRKMDRYLEEYCKLYIFSGVLRITYKGNVIYEKCMGYSNYAQKILFTGNSMFTFYSLSKPLCAIGLLKLYDKGLLSLEDHPSKYVPEASDFDTQVTIRSMLQHSSGMPDLLKQSVFRDQYKDESDIRKLIKAVSEFPMVFAPDTASEYANINYNVIALIIENIAGISYQEYMRKEVFEPLGMDTAIIDNPGLDIAFRVQGYDINGNALVPADRNIEWMLGAGDVIGTVDDVYCLNKAVKYRKLLKQETWERVLTPSKLSPFGFGCSITNWHNKKRITHTGGHVGFRNLHIQLPEDDFDIILLSNCGFGNSRVTIPEAIYSAFYGEELSVDKQNQMDFGYISQIGQCNENLISDNFLPQRPERREVTAEEEGLYLGMHGGLCLKKDDNDYCMIDSQGKAIKCYYIGEGMFANKYIDECYKLN